MRTIGQADRGGGAGDFLHRDAMLEIAEPRPAIFFLHSNSVQAEVAEFWPEVARKLIALVDLGGAWRNFMRRELADRFANCVRGLAEIEIEHPLRVGNHLNLCLRSDARITRKALSFS